MKLLGAAVALFFSLVGPALAADPQPSPTPVTTLEAGASSDHLSNGSGEWNSTYFSYVRHSAPRSAVYGSLSSNVRFGQTDPQYTAGIYTPTSSNTILNLEASFSPTHAILPQNEISASLEHRLALGWGYSLGLDRRAYSSLDVRGESLLIDRYWHNFRAAYKLTGVQLSNVAGSSFTHTLLFTHAYSADGLSQITFSVNAGRDAESVGTGVLVSSVAGASLSGTQWFQPSWAVIWSIATTRQGTLYSRSGVQIGIRRRL